MLLKDCHKTNLIQIRKEKLNNFNDLLNQNEESIKQENAEEFYNSLT